MQKAACRAVTFIDVVASLTVVALLFAAIVPLLKRCGDVTREQRENGAAKILSRALTSYTLDNNDALVVAHPNWGWVHASTSIPPNPVMQPLDPYNSTRRLTGTIAKTYMSHLASDGRIKPQEMQVDPATAAAFAARSTQPATISPPNLADFSSTSAQAGVLWHPSLGYNGVFIGGSYRHGAFSGPNGLSNEQYGGAFYLQRLSQAVAPSRLIAFVTARGGDVGSGQWWSFGASAPNSGQVHPGYWLVTPPRTGLLPNGGTWHGTLNVFDSVRVPGTWGNVDCRAGSSKALVAQLDGSNQTLALESLRDMRRWANQATGPNWQWTPGQNAAP